MRLKYHLEQWPGLGPGVVISRKIAAAYLKNSVKKYANKVIEQVKKYEKDEFKTKIMEKYNKLFKKELIPLTLVSHIHGVDSMDACMEHYDNVKFFDWADIICLLDHNNFMNTHMLEKTLNLGKKLNKKIILGNERAFFYKPEEANNKRCITALCELVNYYNLENTNLNDLYSYNPNKTVHERSEMIEEIIPKHCRRVINEEGIIVIPHLQSTDTIPDIISKNCQNLKKTSLYIPRVKDNSKEYNIIPNGLLNKDLEKILEKVNNTEYFLIEDINAGVWGVNMDEEYRKDSITYQKMFGLFPNLVINNEEILLLYESLKELGRNNKAWKSLKYDTFRKSCVPLNPSFGEKSMFNFTNYNMKLREKIIPFLEEKIPNAELNILSESYGLTPFSGEDYHGKERIRGSFVVVFLENTEGVSKKKLLEELETKTVFDALRKGYCFPFSYNLDSKPLRRLSNYVLRYTAIQKSLFVKRACEFVNRRNKYYYLDELNKRVQYEMIKEFKWIKKITKNEKDEWVWVENDKRVIVTGYESYNAELRVHNSKRFNKLDSLLNLWSLLGREK